MKSWRSKFCMCESFPWMAICDKYEESDKMLLLTSAYISPLCNLWAHIFKLFSTLLAIPRKNGPKIGSRGHSNQTTTMFGQWQFITYSAPKLDANQTRYLQFLDSTQIDFKARRSFSCSIIIVQNKVTNEMPNANSPPTIQKGCYRYRNTEWAFKAKQYKTICVKNTC